MSFGLFEFDPVSGDLRREGAAVKLANQPARVLSLLVSRPGDVVLREEFRRELWGEETFVDFERGLNFCITQVRAALGDSSDNPRFIQTVPRRGYRFIAPVAFQGLSPDFTNLTGTVPPGGDSPRIAGKRPRAATGWRWPIAAAVIAAIALTAWAVAKRPGTTAAADHPASTRVAVLPFSNLTGDARLDYIADGLTDEAITQLGSLSRDRIAVIARTSVMRYRTADKSIPQIGSELDVQFVVEGSLRREGDALRVSTRFIPVQQQTPTSIWDDVFDDASGATSVRQTPVAIRIARHVATQLLPDTNATDTPESDTVVDAAAWDTFMQATAAVHRGTTADIERAIGQLESAVAREPNFAAAWARLAETRHLLAMIGTAAPKDVYPAAQIAAKRAVTAAPNLASAHLAQGLVHLWYNWRPEEAAKSFERALALNPSLAAAHHDYAWALVALGRTDDAVRHITRSRDLDPLSTRANNDVGWLHLFVRQPEHAARACEHTLAIDAAALEAQACLERAYAQQQRFDLAVHAARATLPATADAPTVDPGEAGLRQIWSWRSQQLERAAGTRWVNPYVRAVHYVLLNEYPRALEALEQAYDARAGMMAFLARDPAMDPLRSDPRFSALLDKINRTSF